MKKISIILLCVLFFFSQNLSAQDSRTASYSDLNNEIGVTAGPISFVGGVLYGSIGFWSSLGSSLSHTSTKLQLFGQYGAHYFYQITPWCQVGAKFSFEGGCLTQYADTAQLIVKSKNNMAILSLMPSVRFTYLNRPWVRLYSGIDIGCSYFWDNKQNKNDDADNKGNRCLFALNVTPFGVNVGKKFFGMFEVNLGYDSFLKAGIGARF
ncbi:MAG: hypothetical protein MJZ76_00905 [Bacteroidales bacterium]|nr:hypothetical protein [Bacteroidales bacterium]